MAVVTQVRPYSRKPHPSDVRDFPQFVDEELRSIQNSLDDLRNGLTITPTVYLVANLPSAVTAGAGARAFVTDANAATFNSVVAGGGANFVPLFSDGTNWRIG